MSGQVFLVEGLKHILALQKHRARMSGQVFPVEGLTHTLPCRATMQSEWPSLCCRRPQTHPALQSHNAN